MSKMIICKRCERERKHLAKGLCASCYTRIRQIEQGDNWLKRHADSERERRKRLGDKYREAERKRSKTAKRKRWKEKYVASQKGIESNRKGSRRDRKVYPQRNKARQSVRQERDAGRIPHAKELKCHHCGKQAQEYHHHKGYAKEFVLDVIPLCKPCHTKADHELNSS